MSKWDDASCWLVARNSLGGKILLNYVTHDWFWIINIVRIERKLF